MDVSLQNAYGIARGGGGDQPSLGNVVRVREQIPYDVFRLCSLGYGSSPCCCSYDGALSAYCSYDGGQPSSEGKEDPWRVTAKRAK